MALNDAKATTNPLTRTAKLLDAIAWHEDTITTLKKSVFLYRDGVQKINTRLKFDFYKTVEETDVDLVLLLDAIEPLAVGAFEAIAAALLSEFPAESLFMREKVRLEINGLLAPLVGANPPTWANRQLGDILAIRAAVEECLNSIEGNYVCLAVLELVELEPILRDQLTSWLRSAITSPTYDTSLIDSTIRLAEIYQGVLQCSPAFTLDCLLQLVDQFPELEQTLREHQISERFVSLRDALQISPTANVDSLIVNYKDAVAQAFGITFSGANWGLINTHFARLALEATATASQNLVNGNEPPTVPAGIDARVDYYGLYTFGVFGTPSTPAVLLTPYCRANTPRALQLFIGFAPFGVSVNTTAYFSDFPNCTL